MAEMYSRHSLAWLSTSGWRAACSAAAPQHLATLERWQNENWPLIVRRNDADTQPGQICLGLAPPPLAGVKLRISLRVLARDIASTTPALALAAAIGQLSEPWTSALAALAQDSAGLTLRIYGSLALQALTGQPYVSPNSDIDLLFYPQTQAQLRAGLTLLSQHAQTLPLDGEIIFPDAQAVAWKEWLAAEAGSARVLVKAQSAVRLATTEALLASLPI